MADYSVTIANGLPMLGMSPSSGNWNAVTWNAFLWGYTLDLPISVDKGISNSEAATTALGFDVVRGFDDSTTLDGVFGLTLVKDIGETLTLDGDIASQYLTDSAGYFYVFVSNVTNAKDRDFTTWADPSSASVSWATATAFTTTWS